jgi:hypothetical protein
VLLEDGRYEKYAESITHSLEEQKIQGADLSHLQNNDLYLMGVVNFHDRQQLLKHFQALGKKRKCYDSLKCNCNCDCKWTKAVLMFFGLLLIIGVWAKFLEEY